MADITNSQIVHFANEKCRILADLIEKTRRTAEQFALDVVAIEGLAAYTGAADADVIIDGSATDGRQTATKLSIGQLKYVAGQMVTALTTDDRAQLVANWSVNGTPAF